MRPSALHDSIAVSWIFHKLCLLSLAFSIVSGDLLGKMSFQAPFLTHDHRGMRIVPMWTLGGDSLVKQSFLRVTPDHPNKLGHVWSRSTIANSSISLILKFRISGNDPREYGDFLALTITTDSRFVPGNLFRQHSDFTGVMVVINLNSKEKSLAAHRDISIIANNGKLSEDIIMNTMEGCSAPLRFYEGRDDFNVLKASRIRVTYHAEAARMEVETDIRNTGRWRRCATLDMSSLQLPFDWLSNARLGLVGATSEMSDNQDVLSLRAFDSADGAALAEKAEGLEDDGDDYMVLVHHMEHELYDVHTSLQKTLEKLGKQEQEAERRIGSLEAQIGKQVLTKLDTQLSELESRVRATVDTSIGEKLDRIENTIGVQFEEGINAQVGKVSGKWKMPFVILLVLLAGVMIAAQRQYAQLKRTHMC